MKHIIKFITITFLIISTHLDNSITVKYNNYYLEGNNIINDDIIKENDDIISNIPAGTTVYNFKSYLLIDNVIIKNNNNEIKNDNDIIYTGDKLYISENNYYTLSVSGDIVGNGLLSLEDAKNIANHIIDDTIQEESKQKAADFNNDNTIKMNDAMKLLSSISEKHKIHFLNTGDSDAILLESNGHFGLVDTGRESDGVKYYLNEVLGNKKLEVVIITHPHEDHSGGIISIAPYVNESTKYYYGEFRQGSGNNCEKMYNNLTTIKNAGATLYEIGDNTISEVTNINLNNNDICITTNKSYTHNSIPEITLGEYTIKILNSEYDTQHVNGDPSYNVNRNSLIQLVTYNNYRILLTGDMEVDDEERFLCTENARNANECRSDKLGRIDILKFCHHASSTSNSNDFLNLLKPKDGIITADKFNHYERNAIDGLRYTQKYFKTNIYDTAYDDEERITLDNQVESKKAIIVTFDSSGYTINSPNNTNNINKAKFSALSTYNSDYNPYWEKINFFNQNGWYYYDTDISKKGFTLINAYKSQASDPDTPACYYFSPLSGAMTYGWQAINRKLYYFGPSSGITSGIMQTGTINIDGTTYTLNNDNNCNDNAGGYLIWNDGWFNLNDNYYYFDESNKYIIGWYQIDNYWYYFSDQGIKQTGWQLINNKWYYLNSDGKMISNTCQIINNKEYCFDDNGVCTSQNC